MIRRVVPDTLTVMEEGCPEFSIPCLGDRSERAEVSHHRDKAFQYKIVPPGTHAGVLLLRPDEYGIHLLVPQYTHASQEGFVQMSVFETFFGAMDT